MIRKTLVRMVAMGQGLFYLGTGLWPIVSSRAFERVTGSRTDDRLATTAGASIAVTGATLALAGLRGRVAPDAFVLGAGSAAALGALDVANVARGTVPLVSLADAIVEAGIVGAWLVLYPLGSA